MANVRDVAAYILENQSPMTAMKLQKLAYYSQAWHLVWSGGTALFPERIEAWANGPVIPELFSEHRGQMTVTKDQWVSGESNRLSEDEKSSIDAVMVTYGTMAPFQLSDQTHSESPWKDAREGVAPGERSQVEISLDSMYMYYDGLVGLGKE